MFRTTLGIKLCIPSAACFFKAFRKHLLAVWAFIFTTGPLLEVKNIEIIQRNSIKTKKVDQGNSKTAVLAIVTIAAKADARITNQEKYISILEIHYSNANFRSCKSTIILSYTIINTKHIPRGFLKSSSFWRTTGEMVWRSMVYTLYLCIPNGSKFNR